MRESKKLEFKENIETNSYLKTISAYANYGEGVIIFGITDNGTVKGICDPETACLNLENRINDSIKPIPEYTLEIEPDSTIKLTIYEGPHKPYLYKGKAYQRHDTATIELDRLSLNRLVLEGANRSFEGQPSQQQNLTFAALEKELVSVLEIDALTEDILKTLELYTKDIGYNNAAALLADMNQFKGVDLIRFGEDIDEIMDRQTFEQMSILHQLSRSLEMYQKYYQYEKIDGAERKTVEKVPEKAFREAIANALIHRTWDVNASIKVSMFEDRIEISSPGGLPPGIDEEEYLHGQISILRNPIIGNVFFRLKHIEKFGTGIMRINHAYADSLKKPAFRIFTNSILVVLPVIKSDADLTRTEKQILAALKRKTEMTRAQISAETGLGKDKTIRALNVLLDKNFIDKQGAGRSVKYMIF